MFIGANNVDKDEEIMNIVKKSAHGIVRCNIDLPGNESEVSDEEIQENRFLDEIQENVEVSDLRQRLCTTFHMRNYEI
jgi:hypothetical protein